VLSERVVRRILPLVIVFVAFPLFAQEARMPVDVSALGPQVGDRVPDFSLPGQDGSVQTLSSIMGPNGAMLVFFRSADW